MQYREVRRSRAQEALQSFHAFLEEDRFDPFKNWEKNCFPEKTAESQLRHGLELLYGQVGLDVASRFFRRCLDVVSRTEREKTLDEERCQDAFEYKLCKLLRAKAFATALLQGCTDQDAFLRSSQALEAACRLLPWDIETQAEYLEAVWLAIIADDTERAERLLRIRRRFKNHSTEVSLSREILACIRARHALSSDVRETLDRYFDLIRTPDQASLKGSVFVAGFFTPLSFGAVRDKALFGDGNAIDWPRTVDAVSM